MFSTWSAMRTCSKLWENHFKPKLSYASGGFILDWERFSGFCQVSGWYWSRLCEFCRRCISVLDGSKPFVFIRLVVCFSILRVLCILRILMKILSRVKMSHWKSCWLFWTFSAVPNMTSFRVKRKPFNSLASAIFDTHLKHTDSWNWVHWTMESPCPP